MSPVQQTIERIRAYVVSLDISNRKLAEQADVAETTVRNIRRHDWNPTAETIDKLSRLVPEHFDPNAAPEPKQAAQ